MELEGHESNDSISIQNDFLGDVHRPLANFHPDIWGNQFLLYSPDFDKARWASMKGQVEQLKEKVRTMLQETASNPLEQLQFIDAIQRLGIEYQFEEEISQALQKLHEKHQSWEDNDHFYTAALYFRILRQEGFRVSADIFKKFLDAEGKFGEGLVNDVQGMLALYEAAHLMLQSDDILDHALAFTSNHLQSLPCKLSDPLAELVNHALMQPYWRGIPRLEARNYLSIYEKGPLHNTSLLKLAKLDFNMLQSLHKEELQEISLWWKELDFGRKLPFARDRMVEGYFWIIGVYFEPQYALARKIMSKVIAIASIIDDIYDAYGTYNELEIFTEAIERWNVDCMKQLPDYMKICYQALLDVFEEIEEEMANQGRSYRTYYAKEALKLLACCYFAEAKWLHQGYIPTVEEYMQIAVPSCGYITLAMISFVGMGDVTKAAFEWAMNDPDIIRASSIVCRLRADIVGHKFERERKHIASAVECYMKQHGMTEQQACEELYKQIEDAWKLMNQQLLKPTPTAGSAAPEFVPSKAVLFRVLNLTRFAEVTHMHNDDYTHVGGAMQSYIKSLFIEPVSM
ncbi:(-)-germacrene D synthase-like isoform X1 [Coffea arabica]|uniref:(-)-germacrene D synthase-like isoform X1 n=1 Tax=Coffea arabica TaxID=13443 RepID=A0ABM4U534_COFAR